MKDWNGNVIAPGRWVIYTQHDIMRIGRVLAIEDDGKVSVEWHKARWGSLPGKPGQVNYLNLTVTGWIGP